MTGPESVAAAAAERRDVFGVPDEMLPLLLPLGPRRLPENDRTGGCLPSSVEDSAMSSKGSFKASLEPTAQDKCVNDTTFE